MSILVHVLLSSNHSQTIIGCNNNDLLFSTRHWAKYTGGQSAPTDLAPFIVLKGVDSLLVLTVLSTQDYSKTHACFTTGMYYFTSPLAWWAETDKCSYSYGLTFEIKLIYSGKDMENTYFVNFIDFQAYNFLKLNTKLSIIMDYFKVKLWLFLTKRDRYISENQAVMQNFPRLWFFFLKRFQSAVYLQIMRKSPVNIVVSPAYR